MADPSPPPRRRRGSLRAVLEAFVHERLDLAGDAAYEGQTLESVRRGVQFKGANLWILMFAILICSVGLNVNSPAVVIGAMLISPLMGPILGIGVGVGIYDFDLLLTSLKNLGIATAVSVAVSGLYFAASPITTAQSELLARVSPTLFDVLIALGGGFAGIIAVSRREKTNVLPGVAIATALMPPICTAGYALALGKWVYLFGALYLFFINVTFISFTTFVMTRWMGFSRHQFVDDAQERRVRQWIYAIVALVAIPSVYTAYTTVQDTLYVQRVNRFVGEECQFANAEIVGRELVGGYADTGRAIELVLLGQEVDSVEIARRREAMPRYGLAGTRLVVLQDEDDPAAGTATLASTGANSAVAALYHRSEEALARSELELERLRGQVAELAGDTTAVSQVLAEARALFPGIRTLSYGRLHAARENAAPARATGAVHLRTDRPLAADDETRLSRWLGRRMGADTVLVIH